MNLKALAIASVLAAIVALAILIIPFVGVYVSAILGPLAIILGTISYRRSNPGDPLRRTALAGAFFGGSAVFVLAIFLLTGAYSEYAR